MSPKSIALVLTGILLTTLLCTASLSTFINQTSNSASSSISVKETTKSSSEKALQGSARVLSPAVESLQGIAHVLSPAAAFKVEIKPEIQSGTYCETLTYTVTLTNLGSADNFDLTVTDNEGWNPTLADYRFENVGPNENVETTLYVHIPDVPIGTIDNITVIATSEAHGTSENDSCYAHRGMAKFEGIAYQARPYENWDLPGGLYVIRVSMSMYISGELVVEFYDYGWNYETENVVWSGSGLVQLENFAVGHAAAGATPKRGVKQAKLVLRTATENKVLDTWTTTRINLFKRLSEVKMAWKPHPEYRVQYFGEMSDIKMQWKSAA